MPSWMIVGQNQRSPWYGSMSGCFHSAFSELGDSQLYDLCIYPDRWTRLLHRLMPMTRQRQLGECNRQFLDALTSSKPDHVFVNKGTHLLPETLKVARDRFPQTTFSCFHPDDPFGAASKVATNQAIMECIPLYDHYFIWAKHFIEPLERRGAMHVHYLPFAVDPSLFYPADTCDKLQCDIAFVGTAEPERVRWIRAIREALPERVTLRCHGNGWPAIPGVQIGPQVVGEGMLSLLSSCRIAINVLRLQNKQATNMRTFELPAMEIFMLHEYSEAAASHFEDGTEAVFFASPEEFVEKACYYLENADERRAIAQRGRAAIFEKHHTYLDRAKEIASIVVAS